MGRDNQARGHARLCVCALSQSSLCGSQAVSKRDGKLVKVTGDKGQPTIVVKDKDGETSFEIFAAQI